MWIKRKKLNITNRALLIASLAALTVLVAVWAWHTDKSQEATPSAPVPAQSALPSSQRQATALEPDPVLQLFNPSQASLDEQLSDASLKSRLEEAMTTSFILKRCGLVSDEAYNQTYQALMLYAQRMQPGLSTQQLQENFAGIVASSSASYGLIYARLSCDTPQLSTAAAQLAQWRHHILNPPQQ